jgi:uncharacterized BrkB/YihY/UPF0761 family membrane protein
MIWQAISDRPVPDLLTRGFLAEGIFKLASIPFTFLILFLVYWRLPNCKVPARQIWPRACVIALLLEALKWINFAIWPWIRTKFQREYGGFADSITILTWSFFAGLIVLAGADWSARRARQAEAVAALEAAGNIPAAGLAAEAAAEPLR